MCLENPTTKEPLVAEEDIEVYKYGDYEGDCLKTTFMNYVYGIDILQPLVKVETEQESWGECIRTGYHSFENIRDRDLRPIFALGRFIIPKGTKYYKGFFCGKSCYTSETIIFKGFIK